MYSPLPSIIAILTEKETYIAHAVMICSFLKFSMKKLSWKKLTCSFEKGWNNCRDDSETERRKIWKRQINS
jgi:hypothetical protein